jgi:PAS domain S-box-containing protein
MNIAITAPSPNDSATRDPALLAAIVESHEDAIISRDLDGRILSWNPAAVRMFGYTAAEAIGQPISLIIPPDRLEEQRQILEIIGRGEHVRQLETERVAKDGRVVQVSVTVSPVRDAEGAIVGAAKIARDITARTRAERTLQQSNEELNRRTAELARFNHAAVRREMRMIELTKEVNELRRRLGEEQAYRLEAPEEGPASRSGPTGPEPVERDGPVPLEAVLRTEQLWKRPSRAPDYEAESRALASLVQALADDPRTILQALADKTLEVLSAGSAGLSLLARDGERFYWAAIAGQWSPHLGGGTPSGFGPCGDVLDRDAPLLFSHWEKRYPYLASATPLAEEGLLVPFHAGGKAVGTIWVIAHDAGRKFDSEDVRMLQSLGRFASAAYEAVESLGAVEQRRAALNLLEDAVRARKLAEDSNRQLKQSEAALREADQRKNEFLALLGHELRNPLMPISNASELLARSIGNENTNARAAIDMVKRQVSHLTRLVDDLLDVSRITQGRVQLRCQPVEVGSIIAEALETVEPQLRAKQHRIHLDTSAGERLYVSGDSTRLVQCLANVLVNAVKYTDAGGEVRVRVRASESTAIIEVSDSGVGIAPELLPRIFDHFVQGDRGLDRSQGGLGIGLAIVRQLIRMHGGEVTARSDGHGAGSTFEIRLPRVTQTEDAPTEALPEDLQPLRVLIVDDNVDAAISIAMLLTAQGHHAETVYSGEDALKAVHSFKPEVALLDIGLPGMDGYELASRLRELPACEGMRLIALTGYGQSHDRRRALDSGFDDHLVKPVPFRILERTLAGREREASP